MVVERVPYRGAVRVAHRAGGRVPARWDGLEPVAGNWGPPVRTVAAPALVPDARPSAGRLPDATPRGRPQPPTPDGAPDGHTCPVRGQIVGRPDMRKMSSAWTGSLSTKNPHPLAA